MQIYLSEEEIRRERNLFSPHETSYRLLEGVAIDIRSLREQETQDKTTEECASQDSIPATFVPPSC